MVVGQFGDGLFDAHGHLPRVLALERAQGAALAEAVQEAAFQRLEHRPLVFLRHSRPVPRRAGTLR